MPGPARACTKESDLGLYIRLIYGDYTYVCVPAVFTDESFSKRPSSKFKACAMSRLSRFRFLRFSADGITFGDSSPASVSDSKQNDLKVFNKIWIVQCTFKSEHDQSSLFNYYSSNLLSLFSPSRINSGRIYIYYVFLSQKSSSLSEYDWRSQ